jgi:hypothetical protein
LEKEIEQWYNRKGNGKGNEKDKINDNDKDNNIKYKNN